MRLTVVTETLTVDIRDGVRYSPDVLDDWTKRAALLLEVQRQEAGAKGAE
jgi:hypothetical protein